jgi:hypothetical protein
MPVDAVDDTGSDDGSTAEKREDGLNTRHVRSLDAPIKRVIALGELRSVTFRALVDQIERSDVVVYLQQGSCSHGAQACLLHRVTVAGPYRILRVVLDVRHRTDSELIQATGHELYHVVEVARDSSIRTDGLMFHLFNRIGSPSGNRFETNEAVQAGETILDEFMHGEHDNRQPESSHSATSLSSCAEMRPRTWPEPPRSQAIQRRRPGK